MKGEVMLNIPNLVKAIIIVAGIAILAILGIVAGPLLVTILLVALPVLLVIALIAAVYKYLQWKDGN